MKICFLVFDITRKGGVEHMACILASELAAKHQVTILSVKNKEKKPIFDIKPAVKTICLSNGSNVLKNVLSLRNYLKTEIFDIVINVDTGMAIYGIPATLLTNTKCITWEHSNYYNNWNSSKFAYFRRFAAKHSDALVVLTEKDKKNYTDNIRNCCPINVIPNPSPEWSDCYDCDSKIILSVGQLLPIKRFQLAIEIASVVLKEEPEWKWIICGEGRERESLEKLICDKNLQNQVLLPGTVVDMETQYQNASIVVMTSSMEGLPMALLEAKAHGIPIVSFDIMTGPSDIIEDSINGFLIQDNDIETMAEKVSLLMKDCNLRSSFSKQAKIGLEKFDLNNVLNSWEQLFMEV